MIHHYETAEAKFNGVVVLNEGVMLMVIGELLPDGTTLGEEQSIYPVSNYEWNLS